MMKLVSLFSPLTYANDLARAAFGLNTILNPTISSIGLLAFMVLFMALGTWLHEKLMEWMEAPRGHKRSVKEGVKTHMR